MTVSALGFLSAPAELLLRLEDHANRRIYILLRAYMMMHLNRNVLHILNVLSMCSGTNAFEFCKKNGRGVY